MHEHGYASPEPPRGVMSVLFPRDPVDCRRTASGRPFPYSRSRHDETPLCRSGTPKASHVFSAESWPGSRAFCPMNTDKVKKSPRGFSTGAFAHRKAVPLTHRTGSLPCPEAHAYLSATACMAGAMEFFSASMMLAPGWVVATRTSASCDS